MSADADESGKAVGEASGENNAPPVLAPSGETAPADNVVAAPATKAPDEKPVAASDKKDPPAPNARPQDDAEQKAKEAAKDPEPVGPPPKPPWAAMLITGLFGAASIISAIFICTHLLTNAASAQLNEGALRFQLSTLVCFLGMTFACLGFGLFAIGATGSLSARSGKGSKTPATRVETSAPGLVVMLCATLVIYFAVDLAKPPAPEPLAAPPAADPQVSPTKSPPSSPPANPTIDAGVASDAK